MHQTIPMLFDQSDVDIGFAHRSDFCGHFGAAWQKRWRCLEFLQPRAKIKPSKRAPYPFTKRTGKSMKSTVYPDHPAPVLALRTVTYCTETRRPQQHRAGAIALARRADVGCRDDRARHALGHPPDERSEVPCGTGTLQGSTSTSRRSTASSCYNWPKWPSPMRRTTLCWWVGWHRQEPPATAIGVAGITQHGKRVRFYSTVDLVNALEQEKAQGKAGRIASSLLRLDAVVLDEMGYLPFSQVAGAAVPPASKLYEHTSVVVTTNLDFAEWEQRVRGSEDDHCVAGPAHAPLPSWRRVTTVTGSRTPRRTRKAHQAREQEGKALPETLVEQRRMQGTRRCGLRPPRLLRASEKTSKGKGKAKDEGGRVIHSRHPRCRFHPRSKFNRQGGSKFGKRRHAVFGRAPKNHRGSVRSLFVQRCTFAATSTDAVC